MAVTSRKFSDSRPAPQGAANYDAGTAAMGDEDFIAKLSSKDTAAILALSPVAWNMTYLFAPKAVRGAGGVLGGVAGSLVDSVDFLSPALAGPEALGFMTRVVLQSASHDDCLVGGPLSASDLDGTSFDASAGQLVLESRRAVLLVANGKKVIGGSFLDDEIVAKHGDNGPDHERFFLFAHDARTQKQDVDRIFSNIAFSVFLLPSCTQ